MVIKAALPAADDVRRIQWLDGQALEAADLTAHAERERLARRLHTSVVHATWGVAIGFGVVGGSRQTSEVVVAPGLAYDVLGREIISARTLRLSGPRAPRDGADHWADLVIRWADPEDLRAGRDPAGRCAGAAVYEERPLVRWVDAGPVRRNASGAPVPTTRLGAGVRLGIDVPLARFVLAADGTLGEADLATRRVAHGRVRPHIAAGTVRQGTADITGDHRWWSVRVDTAVGGFQSGATSYFASLGAHPWGESSGFGSATTSDGSSARQTLAALLPVGHGPFLAVSQADRSGFWLTVRHGLPKVGRGADSIMTARNPVPVHWLGIEWVGGCEPATSSMGWLAAILLAGPVTGLIGGIR